MMLRHCPCWFVLLAAFLLVKENNAQNIPVAVTFDPPSPVPEGVTIFRCDFNITPGQSLFEQYWATIGNEGLRFFQYQPGSLPDVDPDYIEKFNGYQTDDETFLEIYFDVTACDTQTYECYVLDTPNNDEGRSLQSLAVENLISPSLRYGDQIITTDMTITHSAPETVSCQLYNAGPPLPETLALLITEEDGDSSVLSTDDYEKTNVTCKWSYLEPLQYGVIDLTEGTTFQCSVSYRDTAILESPVLTLLDGITAFNP